LPRTGPVSNDERTASNAARRETVQKTHHIGDGYTRLSGNLADGTGLLERPGSRVARGLGLVVLRGGLETRKPPLSEGATCTMIS
jgi:hypothetical protein